MSHSPRFLFRRATTQKNCPVCGAASPADLVFCGQCGTSIARVAKVLVNPAEQLRQFRIPEYLSRDDPLVRRRDSEPAGTGLVWIGLVLIAIPTATQNVSPVSIAAWLAGLAAVVGGVVRTRSDGAAMLRAGAVTGLAGIITLAIITNGVLRPPDHTQVPEDTAVVAADQTESDSSAEDTTSEDEAPQMDFMGSVPMLRGSADHTGMNPGPAIAGNPYRAWRYDTGELLTSTPAVANGSAYFGTRDGYLIALDLLTGMPRWRFDLGGYPVSSAPAVADRTVFVGSGYAFFAIDEERGIVRWRFPMSYAGESSPTVANGVVYVASKEHNLYALDAETGEKLWSYRTEGLIFGSPSLSEELVVIGGDDGDVFGIDRDSGISRWKYTASSGVYSTIAIQDDLAIVTLNDKSVIALDLQHGDLKWEYSVGGSASPAIVGEQLFIGSDDGALYALNTANGGPPRWLFPTGNGAVLSPVLVGDTVIIAAGPTLFALERTSGEELWRYPIGDQATTEPVVVDGMIYIGAEDGSLYAITGDGQLATPEPESD